MSRRPTPLQPADATPCEAFVEAAMLRVDRELPRIQEQALERHLAACPLCRRRVREAEGVSRALKNWDAERGSRVRAPDRLGLQVRGAILEAGRKRRQETQRVVLSRIAMAAAVVLVFAGAILAGLARPLTDGDAAPTAEALRAGAPSAEAEPWRPAPPADERRVAMRAPHAAVPASRRPGALPPSPLAALEAVGPSQLVSLSEGERVRVRDVLTRIEIARREQSAFEAVVGEPGLLWVDPVTGRDRWITVGALATLQHRYGAGSVEGLLRGFHERFAAARLPGHEYASPPPEAEPLLPVTHVVRLPRDREALDAWLAHPASGTGAGGLGFHQVPIEGAGAAPTGVGTVEDLQRAVARGVVRLHEGTGDDLVLLARGLDVPVFVPVGELIAGGGVDRVVSRAVWIPASEGEERFHVSCRAVSSRRQGSLAPLRPVGLVAGPELRRLLESGADRDEVIAFVLDRALPGGMSFSLLAWYDHDRIRRVVRQTATGLRMREVQAFLVTNDRGGFQGYEASSLPREAASRLLARLWIGYGIEAGIPVARRPSQPETVPVRVTIQNLLEYEGALRTASEGRGPLRTARLHDVRSDVVVTTFEESGTGRPLHASALP